MKHALRRLTASPARVAASVAAITPGMHLLLSVLVERRRVTWQTEYPAVLVGDPLLALSAGIAASVAGADTLSKSALLRRGTVAAWVAGAVAFGAWQMRDEVRHGVYTTRQALSPTKLWHQFVVYPVVSTLVGSSVLAATAAAASRNSDAQAKLGTAIAWGCVAAWAALTVEGIRHPRQGHGEFDWRSLSPVRPERDAAPTGTTDAGTTDAGAPDAGAPDAGTPWAGRTPDATRTSDVVLAG